MRLFDSLFGRRARRPDGATSQSAPPAVAKPDPCDDPDQIRVFDKFGREFFITKERWCVEVLPGVLKANWDNPEQLSGIIVGALTDGFFPDILDATEHLHRIDPVFSRGTCVYAIALLKNHQLDAAEHVLRAHLERHGEDGSVLTNLAKVYAERRETAKAEATLWHALEVDPNQENGLAWYVSIVNERQGKEAAVEAWRRVASIPGSWRAHLWLARTALESHDPERALALYRESLSHLGQNIPSDVLMQISGDLGNHGLLAELLELCKTLFVPEIHGVQVGNNLIKANLDLGRVDDASRILNQLFALKRPDWKEHLSYWDTEIAKARIPKPPLPSEVPLEATVFVFQGPVWLSPGPPLNRLFPANSTDGPVVCLLGSTAEIAGDGDDIRCQLPDAPGRMSRALPLFLAEQIELMTSASTRTLVPLVEKGTGGFVLGGAAWSDVDAVDYAKRSQPECEYVITVHLITRADPWEARLQLISVTDSRPIGDFIISFLSSRPEEGVPEISRRLMSLLKQMGVNDKSRPESYAVPEGSNLSDYLLRLEQLLAVRCADREGAQTGFLSGEREILSGNLNLCLACPGNITTRVLLIQTALAMKKVRPDVFSEFGDQMTTLQVEHPLSEPAQSALRELLAGRSA